jgi:predicted permease
MGHILETVVPVFLVILLGAGLSRQGALPASVLGPLNRLVYYIAIPAMIFLTVRRAPFREHAAFALVFGTLVPVVLGLLAALALAPLFRLRGGLRGTFAQCAFHGNLGYVGLAVSFYYLGDKGLARAGILAAFLMLLQNVLAVAALEGCSGAGRSRGAARRARTMALRVLGNPVILGVAAGLVFSCSGLPLPVAAERTLSIVADMSLPLALLVIGAGLSFGLVRERIWPVLGAGAVKLFFMPAAGAGLYSLAGLPPAAFLPGVILLAAPSATVCHVMGREMGGSPDFATAAISVTTLLSMVSYSFWLGVLS